MQRVWMRSDAMEWHGTAWDRAEGAIVKCQASSFELARIARIARVGGWMMTDDRVGQ